MNTQEEKKQFMRDYWLDALSDSQSARLETEWFGSDEDAESLEIARNDLIEDYLTDNLGGAELNRFKSHFLINNLEDVAIAKSYYELGQTSPKEFVRTGFFEGLAEALRNFMRVPQIAFAVLLLGSSALLIWFYNSQPGDLARNDAPGFDVANKNQTAPNAVPGNETHPVNANQSSNPDAENKNNQTRDKATDKPANAGNKTPNEKTSNRPAGKIAQPQILFLTNFRGSVRTLKLADENKTFALKLDMPGIEKAYRRYAIRIYNSKNELVVEQKLAGNLSLKKSGAKIEIGSLNKDKFRKNETYKTSLVGYDEKNNAEELSIYDSFKVD
jgi:hypothetical protein